mmetsp:Transcript_25414/g.32044  ORF Transcript_25414/g.32044 Transcript_25414/m.32044 type:complete len:382 (+) Transcript_25414:137-1282(+)|eukprot:CAMPEP_0203649448 /NCGR_PEP_ID=MMETSP0088-20131115/21848_1 /ASSEMBLY_ACC=CAM_ASM_001087 /TAXON_ID=426623 /ORGANISM="Chaetoceros affinis, Strain CCMP159" /LENGTH=381 /DNA_ID=CAMNT_0050507869 /DNA_START=167 /DNA_END=1312 /DNA_ORIENTATION=+
MRLHSPLPSRAFHCFALLLLFLVSVSVAYTTGGNPPSFQPNNGNKKDISTGLNDKQKSSPASFPLAPPERKLAPPFPDGLNGGQLVTLPPSEHYLLDSNLSGNTLLLPPRDILVWLPPDYEHYPNMSFPVLYCHDGQNAIFDSSSWTGFSWRLAGCLTRLSERKLLTRTTSTHSPPIVVMIPCADERIASLVPRRHLEYGDISQTFAQAHADFVALTLKPLIDSKFRTLKSVEHTSTIGSSLGGQASFHLLVRHPNVFGNAACLSPAFQPSILTAVATTTSTLLKRKRIYMDNGGDEEDVKVPFVDLVDFMSNNHWWNPGYWWLDTSLQPSIDAMKLVLDAKGVKYAYNKIPGGRHNERAWALRIHKPLLALYGDDEQIDA